MDAANIDLKGFTDGFYKNLSSGRLVPVLETLEYLKYETSCWFEITTLLIPGENDSPQEIEAESRWVMDRLGPDVPLHFTAFHPDCALSRPVPHLSGSSLRCQNALAQPLIRHHLWYMGAMAEIAEIRLIEALKKVDVYGDIAPPHVQDPMTMVLRQNAIQADLIRWDDSRAKFVLTSFGPPLNQLAALGIDTINHAQRWEITERDLQNIEGIRLA